MGKVQNKVSKAAAPVPKGKPKSGRIWKAQKTRASSMIKSKSKIKGEVKERQERIDRKRIQAQSRAILEQKKMEKAEKQSRIAENKKRKEENARKSEIVQVIKNPAKLKRMKKKQLRKIEKRNTTKVEKVQKSIP